MIDDFADAYLRRRDAGALHPLQPDGEVPRPARHGPRPRRRGAGDRPLRPPRRRARTGPELHRAADPARDQSYFLFATTREQLDFLRFPLGGLPKAETRALAAALRPAGRRQARQPGHLLRAERPLCRRDREAAARGGRARRHRPPRRPRARPPRGRRSATPSASAAGWASAAGEPLFVVRLDADARRVIVGPREALLAAARDGERGQLARRRRRSRRRRADGWEVAVRVRSTRPPRRPGSIPAGRPGPASSSSTPRRAWRPARPACFYAPEGTPRARRRLDRARRRLSRRRRPSPARRRCRHRRRPAARRVASIATPTGRPRASPSASTKPVSTSTGCPTGLPSAERHEDHLVAAERLAVPRAVLADEGAVARSAARAAAPSAKPSPSGAACGPERVVGHDRAARPGPAAAAVTPRIEVLRRSSCTASRRRRRRAPRSGSRARGRRRARRAR